MTVLVFLINNSVSALEIDLECPENKVVVVRTTNPNPVCVFETTAERWVQLEYAEIIRESTIPDESKPISTQKEKYEKSLLVELNPSFEFDKVANSYIVTLSGGELENPLTFETFTMFEPGDKSHYVKSFYDLGFTTNFVLESLPSKDKQEFYQIVERYLSPGKTPEPFDVDVDILDGTDSKLITVSYSKCDVTGYTPHTQEFVLFYQYSGQPRGEIRDITTIYCAGIIVDIHNESEFYERVQENSTPNDSDRAQSYVVHFFGPDFDGLYSLNTFSKFSPSVNFIQTPFDTITFPGNPLGSNPQFLLESIPSDDKEILYREFSKHINPGPEPDPFNVSIDMVTGDDTILQRWNYVDCRLTDYNIGLDDVNLKFPLGTQPISEIKDKIDISCIGINLQVPNDEQFPKQPIRDPKSLLATDAKQAKSFILSVSGGELDQTFVDDSIDKIETIKRSMGLTPLHHDKKYDFGFLTESIPSEDRNVKYEFLSRYINPGKTPEPFDVSIDTVLDDNKILHRLYYTNCDAVDFSWYLQEATFFYQFSNEQRPEIRERYINYCEGFKIEFP